MTKRILIALAVLSLSCVSCNKDAPYNSNSGDNGSRALATSIALNQDVTDSLSAKIGDNEDWFSFSPTEPGEVTVSVVLDDPAGMSVSASLYDSFGRELQTKETNPGTNVYLLDKYEATTDRYFVAMKTTKGEGNYTLKVGFEVPKVEEVAVNTNTEVEENTEKQPSCVPADKCKPGQKCCRSKSSSTTPPPTPPADSDEITPETKTIKGTIVLITPRGDDLSDIKINGIGLKKNVKPGMKAVLRGLKRKVDIYKCLNTSCQATVKATSEELAHYDTVDVVVE